jgi:flagellar basal body P-ring protein FlgI
MTGSIPSAAGAVEIYRQKFQMKTLNLKFNETDFDSFKAFEKAVMRQLGNNVYVGTDNLCVYFEYPKELKAMLRPYPEKKQLEFDLTSSKV